MYVCIHVCVYVACMHVVRVVYPSASPASRLHHRFPAFGGGARLAKRWVSSQMFANHISEEAVDLIVASSFLNPAPHVPPATPTCCFVRFLKLLGSFDWQSSPLVVNINNELSGQ